MNFLEKLSKQELSVFLRVFYNHHNFSSQVVLNNVENIKPQVYLITFLNSQKENQLLVSDQSIKMKELNQHCQKHNLDPDQFKKVLELEWKAFMIAKFGAKYIAEKRLFSIEDTQIFKHVDKYNKALHATPSPEK